MAFQITKQWSCERITDQPENYGGVRLKHVNDSNPAGLGNLTLEIDSETWKSLVEHVNQPVGVGPE